MRIHPRRTRTRGARLVGILAAAGLAAGLVGAAPSQASTGGGVTTFVPPAGTDTPFGITNGPGGIYFAHGATIDRISHGRITEFPVPDPATANVGWLARDGSSPNIWFADRGTGGIGTIDAAGHIVEHFIPAGANGTPVPQSIVFDRHFVYFTDEFDNRIGRFDRVTQAFSFWSVPTADPLGLVRGADGDLYFTERSVDKVGRLDPATGLFTEWSLTAGAFPNRLTTTPDGSVWFTELHVSGLGRIDPSGHLHQYPVVGGPVGIEYRFGHLFTAMYTAGTLTEFDLHAHAVRSWTLPGAVGVLQVAQRHHAIWVADGFGDHVYRVAI